MRTVARQAGVSVATVSRTLNGGPVAPATAERVRRVAAALGYRVNAVGRSLVTARTRVVGVLVPTLTNPVFAGSVTGLAETVRRAGYEILLAVSDYQAGRELEVVETFLSQRVDGLVMTLTAADGPVTETVQRAGVPLVLLYNVPKRPGPPFVAVDDAGAAAAMVAALVQAGHRRIAMVAGRFAESDRARRRYDGYVRALRRAGLAPYGLVEVPFLGAQVAEALAPLLERPDPPTALFCSNDLLALAVIDAVRRLGREVPAHISVSGFDGIEVGRLIRPRLTTVVYPTVEMGRLAGDLLLRRMAGRRIGHRYVPYELFPGDTVAPWGGLP